MWQRPPRHERGGAGCRTPPGESSTASGTGPHETRTRGWAKGPMAVIAVVVLMIAAFFLAYALVLLV
ncbi:DUF6480 family protein [Streptomyces sp. NPDC059909]|uniref:DUF6480 family protein n=1 Tax=Streptomyces sp. NPDC059909 TaxID=3346998 RepID=UPI0036537F5E